MATDVTSVVLDTKQEIADMEPPAILQVETEMCSEASSHYKIRQPKRILHFSDGVLEEYDTDDEALPDEEDLARPLVDPQTLSWFPFLWYYFVLFGSRTVNACDFMGEKLAYVFGITSPKYQYEIEEYEWAKKREEDEKLKEIQDEFWNAREEEEMEMNVTSQPGSEKDEKESRFPL